MFSNQYISSIVFARGEEPVEPYLEKLPAIRSLFDRGSLPIDHSVTFFVGENGTGKSTLLESIAVAYGFNAEGGTKNFNFSTADSHSALYKHITLGRSNYAKDGFFLRAESFYNAASYIGSLYEREFCLKMNTAYGEKSLHDQSHGESFMTLVETRFNGDGLYLLDEPEAALSPMRQMTLIAHIDALVRKHSQFIIATHSPILMAFPGAQILQLSEKGIEQIAYKETEHYQVTKRFLENPERTLRYLLEE